MTAAQLVLGGLLLVTLLAQALLPTARLLIVTGGAAVSVVAATLLGVARAGALFADVPWDVIVILVGLGLVSELFAETRVFSILALRATRGSRGAPGAIAVTFAVAMYLVSGLVNNLTALLLVLPVLIVLLRLLGVGQRYLSWTIGVLLVACNLGGAATPIGDFPAILLLGRGSMTFTAYLIRAAPATILALALLLAIVLFVVRPARGQARDPVATRVSLAVVERLHRRVRLDHRLFVPLAIVLGAMLVAWIAVPASSGVGPEVVSWLGAGVALALRPRTGERMLRTRVDAEPVLFLLSLFLMVAAVRRSGVFSTVAASLLELPVPPAAQLALFLVTAGLLTGVFSAGPGMAALLDVAERLAKTLPAHAVYVGLALAVCAGSSLFLTAATSGPMAQALTERADLRDAHGRPVRFGFFEFLPVGLLAFAVILSVGIAYALALAAWG